VKGTHPKGSELALAPALHFALNDSNQAIAKGLQRLPLRRRRRDSGSGRSL